MKIAASRQHLGWLRRLVTAGWIGCFASIAQGYAFDECDFLQPPSPGLGPDHSLVDTMVTEGAPPGAKISKPLCVGYQAPKET
jgi:hypothetical protein